MPDSSGKEEPVGLSGVGITVLLGIPATTTHVTHHPLITKAECEKFRSEILKIGNLGWCLILFLQTKVPALRKEA